MSAQINSAVNWICWYRCEKGQLVLAELYYATKSGQVNIAIVINGICHSFQSDINITNMYLVYVWNGSISNRRTMCKCIYLFLKYRKGLLANHGPVFVNFKYRKVHNYSDLVKNDLILNEDTVLLWHNNVPLNKIKIILYLDNLQSNNNINIGKSIHEYSSLLTLWKIINEAQCT